MALVSRIMIELKIDIAQKIKSMDDCRVFFGGVKGLNMEFPLSISITVSGFLRILHASNFNIRTFYTYQENEFVVTELRKKFILYVIIITINRLKVNNYSYFLLLVLCNNV